MPQKSLIFIVILAFLIHHYMIARFARDERKAMRKDKPINIPFDVGGDRPIDQFRLNLLSVLDEMNRKIDETLNALVENNILSQSQVARIRSGKLSMDHLAQKIGHP